MDKVTMPALTSLIGRVVKIFKGGPESKAGRLLAVKPDHLVIQSDKEGVLYYRIQHIKSISEDSQDDSLIEVSNDYTDAENFHDVLKKMKYRTIKIDRGGPESRVGQVLAVHDDHLVLLTKEDGILYYKLEHVKSISDNSNYPVKTYVDHPEFVDGETFDHVVDQLMYSRVKVNRGGPEAVDGVLVDFGNQMLTLVVDKQVHHLANYHVRNISVMLEKQENEEGQNNEAKAEKSEDKGKNNQSKNGNNKEANQSNSILVEIRRELNQILAVTDEQVQN